MNEREQRQDEDLGRLIRAGYGQDVRPEAAAGQETLRRLQEVCRAGSGSAEQGQAQGEAASPVGPVVSRVRTERSDERNNTQQGRNTLMQLIARNRWGFGFGAAAAAAAVIVILGLATPRAHAKAAEVMAKGAQAIARLSTIHLRGQLRTLPDNNFGFLSADLDFYPIELWKQFGPEPKWRIEKPGQVAVMDGQQTLLYVRWANKAYKLAQPLPNAFDTDWLHRIANLSATLTNELVRAQRRGWKLELAEQTGADGRLKSIVTVHAKSGLPADTYLRNNYLESADTRRVYRFDAQTERLETVQIYVARDAGEVRVFENQPD